MSRTRFTFVHAAILLSLAGWWVWFYTYTAGATSRPARHYYTEATTMVEWDHYPASGGVKHITVTPEAARMLGLSFEEAVEWFEARWPDNDPPESEG